jgi:hypothetical protein
MSVTILRVEPQDGMLNVVYRSDHTDPALAHDELNGLDARKAALQFARSEGGHSRATLTQHPARVYPVNEAGEAFDLVVPRGEKVIYEASLPINTGMGG